MKRIIAGLLASSSLLTAGAAFAQSTTTAQSTEPTPPSTSSTTGAQTVEQALAQAKADAAADGEDEDTIVVTGTQIRGTTPAGRAGAALTELHGASSSATPQFLGRGT